MEATLGDRISVCMATYNGALYLAKQIESIVEQLEPGDELLVADDGSSDTTRELLHRYQPALTIVAVDRVGGVVPNFSRVLAHARGDYVLLSDQDDVWLPGRASRFRHELKHHELVFCNAWVVDEHLRPTGVSLFDQISPGPGFWRNLVKTSSFVGCCMGFRRSLLRGMLPLPMKTPLHDWLLGLNASLRGRVAQVDTPLMLYRRHSSNLSNTGEVSRNSLARKIGLRIDVLGALAVCLWRSIKNEPLRP